MDNSKPSVQLWSRLRDGTCCVMLTDMPEATLRKVAKALDVPGTKILARELRKVLE